MPQSDDLRVATLRDVVGVVLRRTWLVLAVVVVATGASFLVAKSQTPKYTATAEMMYVQPVDPSNPSSVSSIDTGTMAVQLQSVVNVVDTPSVRARASASLDPSTSSLTYKVSAGVETSLSYPDLVNVSVEATSASAAASIANAYANAVIALRMENEQALSRAAQAVIKDQLKLYVTPASKLTSNYAILVQQLSNLQTAEATATGDFSVIVPAKAPNSPSSPRPIRSAALGFGAGLLAGIGFAFLVGKFDTRIRTHRDAVEILGLPSMGRVPRIHRDALRRSGLVTVTEPDGTVSEALRMLRSNLEWSNIDHNLRTVLVTSSIKGEGKTLTVCNLAVTLARTGKNVVVVDADLRDPRVHKVFNLPNAVGLSSVVLGTVELRDAFHVFEFSPSADSHMTQPATLSLGTDSNINGSPPGDDSEGEVFVLTSGPLPPDPGEIAASRRLAAALRDIGQSNADYVLVDAPPILSVGDAAALSANVDGLLMITNLEMLRRPALVHARELLDSFPCRKLGIVFVGEKVEHDEYYRYKTRSRSSA